MRLRKPFWVVAGALIVIAGCAVFLALSQRKQETDSVAVNQCQALDHLVQVLQYLVTVSDTLNDRQKQLRIDIYENFREEQENEISRGCRDPLDPDVIVRAVREAESP